VSLPSKTRAMGKGRVEEREQNMSRVSNYSR